MDAGSEPRTFRQIGSWRILREERAGGGSAQALRVDKGAVEFDVIAADPSAIEILYRSRAGRQLGTLDAVKQEVEAGGRELVMTMNAGMFTPRHSPVGLLISQGRPVRGLDLHEGQGNFYMKPNGVFAVTDDAMDSEGTTRTKGGAFILEATSWASVQRTWRAATQSGPLLMNDSREHPAFRPDSTSRNIRNGVGVRQGGHDRRPVVFAISNVPVTFHEMAELFSAFECKDALYLDGAVSRMYLPALGRGELGGSFGPMIVVTAAGAGSP